VSADEVLGGVDAVVETNEFVHFLGLKFGPAALKFRCHPGDGVFEVIAVAENGHRQDDRERKDGSGDKTEKIALASPALRGQGSAGAPDGTLGYER